jgi:hypothetical protein
MSPRNHAREDYRTTEMIWERQEDFVLQIILIRENLQQCIVVMAQILSS